MANLWLPGYVPGTLQRPAAEKINELETRNQDLTYSGYGEAIPAIYGESLVSGPVLAGPEATSSAFVYAVAISSVGDLPIERFIGILVNGKREDPPPVITTNPSVFSRGGVSIRLYDGTQTAPDATLKTLFGNEYTDVFPGIAYAVISIPSLQSASLDPANAVKFIVRGRKCFDPRSGQVTWTENPTLHLADYLMSGLHHDPINVIGVEACANWNDSLYSGLPRARTGLVINEELSINDALDLLSTYAECLWSFDGEQVRIIPDAPITGDPPLIPAGSIRANTLTFRSVNLNQIPTAVSVFFSDREKPEWGSLPGHAQTAEHEMYGTLSSKSDLQMPPVYRLVEASRRAWMRLERLQTPGRISWQMNDDGILYKAGDVRRLPNIRGLYNLDVRLMSQPELIAPGIYQMHAEIYRDEHYPESGEGIVLPQGTLLLYDGSGTPGEYEVAYTGEDLPIQGVATGSSGVANEVNPPTGSITGTLTAAGGHKGLPSPGPQPITSKTRPSSSVNPINGYVGTATQPPHTHSVSLNLNEFRGVYLRTLMTLRLLRKTRESGSHVFAPAGAIFLSTTKIRREGIQELAGADVTLQVGNEVKITAARKGLEGGVTTSYEPDHQHDPDPTLKWALSHDGTSSAFYTSGKGGGHNHGVEGGDVAYQNLKEKGVLLYKIVSDRVLMPVEAIVAFSGGTIPPGWVVCNGSHGTPNLVDYFVRRVADETKAGAVLGSANSIRINGLANQTTYAGEHPHQDLRLFGPFFPSSTGSGHYDNTGGHLHQVSSSLDYVDFAYTPKRYRLVFIQYKG